MNFVKSFEEHKSNNILETLLSMFLGFNIFSQHFDKNSFGTQ